MAAVPKGTAAFVSCGGELREGWKGVNLGKTAKTGEF